MSLAQRRKMMNNDRWECKGRGIASHRKSRKVHRNHCWCHRQEQRDSRLTPPRSCPNIRVILSPRYRRLWRRNRFGEVAI